MKSSLTLATPAWKVDSGEDSTRQTSLERPLFSPTIPDRFPIPKSSYCGRLRPLHSFQARLFSLSRLTPLPANPREPAVFCLTLQLYLKEEILAFSSLTLASFSARSFRGMMSTRIGHKVTGPTGQRFDAWRRGRTGGSETLSL